MTEGARRGRALWRVIGSRIVLFAALAVVIQVGIVVADYWFDDLQLADLMVEWESDALAKGVSLDPSGDLRFAVPAGLSRYDEGSRSYFARVRTPEGTILYSNCRDDCSSHLLPQEVNPPDFWSRLLRPGKPIAVAGGRSFAVNGRKAFVEVAILDDHERVMARVLLKELTDHLAVPMSIMLVFVLGGMLVSLRFVLRPIERAAREAEGIDPLDPAHAIDVAGMPREIGNLGAAVNRLLTRTSGLMRAQRVYATAIAHEIRTPLAMARLELGNIDHARARKVEQDLDALTHFVAQVTDLGRLEATDRSAFRTIDLAALGRSVVSDVAPWVYDRGAAIGFSDVGATPTEGHASLVENAVRNLIENAVKHTPPHTGIEVVAGPGPRISVCDDAGLLRLWHGAEEPPDGSTAPPGIGLEIVRRIMRLHRGALVTSLDPARRTTMRLDFDPTGGASRETPDGEVRSDVRIVTAPRGARRDRSKVEGVWASLDRSKP